MKITDWRPINSPVVKGSFTLELPSGMVLKSCTVCQKDDKAWINPPCREYQVDGVRKFEPLIDFIDRKTRRRFSDAVLLALDQQHLKARQ